MMNADRPAEHQRYEEMAVAHVLGGLDESEGRLFRNHLVACTDCRARVGELRALAHDLADVERDERRVRAARALETKRREVRSGEDDPDEPPRSYRPRILTVLGVSAILALTAWNFTLRGTLEQVGQDLDRSVDAGAAMATGAAGEVLQQEPGVTGLAKVQDGSVVVLVDGLVDGRVYGLYLLDGDGEVLFRAPVQSKDARLFSMVDLERGAQRLILTLPEGVPGANPSGTTVFEADLGTVESTA